MRIALALLPLLVAGCAASPLYVERSELRGTLAEVPRDARGEPIFAAIRAMPAGAMPVAQEALAARRAPMLAEQRH